MQFFVFILQFIRGGIGLFCLPRSHKSDDCSGTSVSDMPIADFKRSFVCFAFEFNKIDCVFLFLRFSLAEVVFKPYYTFSSFALYFYRLCVLFGCSVRVFCLNQSMAQHYRCALYM